MCGIAGLLSTQPIVQSDVIARRMDAAMAHRGPDDLGVHTQTGVLLLHRRLSILDLSHDGHQPMHSACGRWTLIYNGEIYNYRELRSNLLALGHHFSSASDTEVLLQLLIRYGAAALQQIRGMYAFCLWDRDLRRALLARDPFGVKPLYFHTSRTGCLLFASELRTVLASGLTSRQIDLTGLYTFLRLGHLTQATTLVEGVQEFPAGYVGQWCNGKLHLHPHWKPSYAPEPTLSYTQLVDRTRASLEESVGLHLRTDVPLGVFLSGGLDSSTILALAGENIRTLSIGFDDPAFDESRQAELFARRFCSEHTKLSLTCNDASRLLEPFLDSVDQPSVDGFNTFCVSDLARQQGLKVVLSGLGADELFGGYPSFRRLPVALSLHHHFSSLSSSVASTLSTQSSATAQRLAAALLQEPSALNTFLAIRGLFSPSEVTALLRYWGFELASISDISSLLQPDFSVDHFPVLLDQVAWLESSLYMRDQLLRDSDNFSMACGLELRVPFVDTVLYRQVSAQPASSRLGYNKKLLRDCMPEVSSLLDCMPKRGFALPFQRWFLSDSSLHQQLLAYSPSVPAGIDLRPWARRWGIMVLNHWLGVHLDHYLT